MRVASLHVYPVKGATGISLTTAEVLRSGIRHDRRFMVVDARGTFLTQRSHPRLALVGTSIDVTGERLTLTGGGRDVTVSLRPDGPSRRVRVWKDDVEVVDVVGDGSAFFSELLGETCALVFMPAKTIRAIETPHGRPGDHVGFADAYPLLVASLGSLTDLNRRLVAKGAAPVPMNRFRPNIVIGPADVEPYAEDRATTMRVGALALRTPKPCARCAVTTVDQATAVASKEPLKTLASYRVQANSVLFAMNAIPDFAAPLTDDPTATIAIGDPVTLTTA